MVTQIFGTGMESVVAIMFLAILAQIGLSYLAQRNLNDQLSLGMQAIVGSNNLQVVDNEQEDTLEGGDDDSA